MISMIRELNCDYMIKTPHRLSTWGRLAMVLGNDHLGLILSYYGIGGLGQDLYHESREIRVPDNENL